jgi:hypothetical protein
MPRAAAREAGVTCVGQYALVSLGRRRDSYAWGTDTTVVRGQLPAGHFNFGGPEATHGPLRGYAFERVVASNVVFDLDEVSLHVSNSIFENCRFRQQATVRNDPPPQGNLGRRPTTYRRCAFEHVQFHIGPGFSVGQARFEECRFHHCRFMSHFSFCADYIDCVFTGIIHTAVFYGRDPDGSHCGRGRNQFRGNDFTDAQLVDVGFRCGIDTTAQQWPDGYQPVVDMA